jgi:8-oxo-dGTP pyrophosphatase MutT (NUDIX family)
MAKVISYTLYSKSRVLVERRPLGNYYAPGELVFPGGRIESSDTSPITAFYRELREETGLKPGSFARLTPVVRLDQDINIIPFLLYTWEGDVPNHVLDKGNPFYWLTLKEMQQSTRIEIATIANLIYALTH